MATNKYKGNLELNWINKNKSLYYEYDKDGNPGKPIWVERNDIKVSEPRILKLVKEYGDVSGLKDPLDNALIRGDNLLALRTLVEMFKEREEKDKVKLVYIDPPFNTGSAFEHYEDNLERSEWLTLMSDRIGLIRGILKEDGIIAIHLDQSEVAYCKILMDEIFGSQNYLNMITINATSPFGFKHTSSSVFSVANYVLLYAKDRNRMSIKKIFKKKHYDTMYEFYLLNPSKLYEEWKWDKVESVFIKKEGYAGVKEAIKELGQDEYNNRLTNFAIGDASRIFRIAAVSGGALAKRKDTIEKSKKTKDKVITHPNDDMDYYFLNGGRILFYDQRLVEIEGELVPGEVLTDVWTDISWMGIAKEGNIEFPKGKKPEKLIKRLILMNTKSKAQKVFETALSQFLKENPGKNLNDFDEINKAKFTSKINKEIISSDIVLDSFLGSGSTSSVAHKMGRRWIGIEIGKHAETHCINRLKLVTDKKNPDRSGISKDKDINWKGGGGFRYYKLGESLLSDHKMNWNLTYEELSQALFMNFDYLFKEKINYNTFFGKSGKNIAICIVAKEMKIIKKDELQKILDKIKNNKTTKITIFTNHGIAITNEDLPDNITIKKIPESILRKYKL